MNIYFCNYFLHQSDVTVDLKTNEMQVHNNGSEPWKVTLLDTGLNTMTGGRLKRAAGHISDAPFLLTYGDGVADVNISALVEFHHSHKKIYLKSIRKQLESPENSVLRWFVGSGFELKGLQFLLQSTEYLGK